MLSALGEPLSVDPCLHGHEDCGASFDDAAQLHLTESASFPYPGAQALVRVESLGLELRGT